MRFNSRYLWSCQSVLEAIVNAQTFLGELFKGEVFLQVSSVDLCVDVAGWEDVGRLDRVNHFVSRSRKRGLHEESGWTDDLKSRDYALGFQRTGFDFARDKQGASPLSCRIYDKSREIEQSGKEWFVDLWRAHGWSEDDGRVWRCCGRMQQVKQPVVLMGCLMAGCVVWCKVATRTAHAGRRIRYGT